MHLYKHALVSRHGQPAPAQDQCTVLLIAMIVAAVNLSGTAHAESQLSVRGQALLSPCAIVNRLEKKLPRRHYSKMVTNDGERGLHTDTHEFALRQHINAVLVQAYREEHLELQEVQSELAAARAESACLAEVQKKCICLSQVGQLIV